MPLYLGPLFMAFGVFSLVLGLAAWRVRMPGALTRFAERCLQRSPQSPKTWRVKGLLYGVASVCAGLWMSWQSAQCPRFTFPDIRPPIALMVSPGVCIIVIVSTATALGTLRRLRSLWARIAFVVLAFMFGVAAGQVVGFHDGVIAGKWWAITFILAVLMLPVVLVDRNMKLKAAK